MSAAISRIVQMILATVFVAASMATTQEAEQRNHTQGLKETDRFVKAGGRMSGAVAKAEQQTQKTLFAYNALVTKPSTSMKGDYKNLVKSVDSMNERVAGAHQKVAEMQTAGEVVLQRASADDRGPQRPGAPEPCEAALGRQPEAVCPRPVFAQESRRVARALPGGSRRSDYVARQRPDSLRDDRGEAELGHAERACGGAVRSNRRRSRQRRRVLSGSQSRAKVGTMRPGVRQTRIARSK